MLLNIVLDIVTYLRILWAMFIMLTYVFNLVFKFRIYAINHIHYTNHPLVVYIRESKQYRNHYLNHSMMQSSYENEILQIMESKGVVYLNSTLHPCTANYLPKNFTVILKYILISLHHNATMLITMYTFDKLGKALGYNPYLIWGTLNETRRCS